MITATHIPNPPTAASSRRGFARQRHRREREQTARRHAVTAGRDLARRGWQWNHVTRFLGLPERTYRNWRAADLHNRLAPRPLGRPTQLGCREDRNDLIHTLNELGPGLSVATLWEMFPQLARATIEDLVQRYRRIWRMQHEVPVHVLQWARPGSVWAIDFHGPRASIDGIYPYLVAVRDLASGYQLLWQPVRDLTADTALLAVQSLVAEHGAPLVLKCDNGSAFIAAEFTSKILELGTRILYSPAQTPQYNGAIEAGIGSLTSRTNHHAARHNHPGHWTWDDVAAALGEANATARPRGPYGPTPQQLWDSRTAITPDQRRGFGAAVDARLMEMFTGHGLAYSHGSGKIKGDRHV